MPENDKVTEFAMLFKERENPQTHQPCTAVVVNESPLVLKVENRLFLSKEYNNVCWSKSILAGYKRDFLIDPVNGDTANKSGGTGMAEFASHSHDYKAPITGSITWTDNPKVGDEYIVIPISNGSMWYVFDKVVKP